jgi:hypothetical protein
MENTIYVSNEYLARALDVVDPFITGKQNEEESAVAAGFEDEQSELTR